MGKIIINSCFGGYSWSKSAIALIGGMRGGVYSEYDESLRTDTAAIAVLEKYGEKLCSGSSARLTIEEYDENLFIPVVEEYDGYESIRLVPNLTEERVRKCGSVDEVVALLKDMHAFADAACAKDALGPAKNDITDYKSTVLEAGLDPDGDEYSRPVYCI